MQEIQVTDSSRYVLTVFNGALDVSEINSQQWMEISSEGKFILKTFANCIEEAIDAMEKWLVKHGYKKKYFNL